ncbi:MAG: hypothetical protein AB1894_29625 [Chloroflexota bacterium]
MDIHSNTFGSDGKHPQRFWAVLLVVRSLINRLANLFSVTQQDLMDAGVYLHPDD